MVPHLPIVKLYPRIKAQFCSRIEGQFLFSVDSFFVDTMALLKIVLVIIAFVALYLYRILRWHRFEQYKDFPQAPSSLLWGHLKLIHKVMQTRGHPGRHAGKQHILDTTLIIQKLNSYDQIM